MPAPCRPSRGAVLLLADGQGGKSTTTALLLSDGARFISDDQTGVTVERQATGTPSLRLRRPSAGLTPAGAETRVEGDGRIVVALQPNATPVPIAGLLLLGGRSASGTVELETVAGATAVTALLAQVFCGGLVDPALIERHFIVAADLAATLPVARLHVPHGPPWPSLLPTIEAWLQ